MILLFESDTLKVYTSETEDQFNDVEYLHIFENGKEVAKIKATASTTIDSYYHHIPQVELDSAGI